MSFRSRASRLSTAPIAIVCALLPLGAAARATCLEAGNVEKPRFASALFSRGQGEAGARLIGNAFSVHATPLRVCGEPEAPSCAADKAKTRTWVLTMVTAAHVVREMCAGSSDAWPGTPDVFREGKLSVYANFDLENANPVEVTVDKAWCGDNVRARDQLSELADRLKGKKGDLPARSDIFVFEQRFDLPATAIAVPFPMQFLPRGDHTIGVIGQGFSKNPTPRHRMVEFSAGRSFFFGDDQGSYSTGRRFQAYGYEIQFNARPGASGSPVGYVFGSDNDDSKRFVVFGVLTDTGKISCAKAKDKAEALQASAEQVGAAVAATDDDDGATIPTAVEDAKAKASVCNLSGDAKEIYEASDTTGYFTPILRYPAMYELVRAHTSNVRIDVAIRLYDALLEARASDPGADLEAYKDELKVILSDLSPLEQSLVLLRSKNSESVRPADLTCPRVEPRDTDFWR